MLSAPFLFSSKSLWSRNPIPAGCVLYLPLWSPGLNGSVFKSADPFGHTCTVTGTTKVDNGRHFDGADDKIVIPNNAIIDITGDITVVVRFKFDAPWTIGDDWMALVDKAWGEAPRDSYTLYFRGPSGDLLFVRSTGGVASAITSWTARWYHLLCTYSATTGQLYVDGVANGTAGGGETDTGNAKDLTIGLDITGGRDVLGTISDVWLYNRSFSAAEALYHHQRTRGR